MVGSGFFRVDLGIISDWFRVYVFFPVSGLLNDLFVVGLGLVYGWIEGWFKIYVGSIANLFGTESASRMQAESMCKCHALTCEKLTSLLSDKGWMQLSQPICSPPWYAALLQYRSCALGLVQTRHFASIGTLC